MPSRTQDTRNTALYRAIGDRVAAIRDERGWTQEELAGRTGHRLSRSAVANIEGGRQRVAVHHLFDLAQALQVSPEDLTPNPSSLPGIPDQGAERLRERVARRPTRSLRDLTKS